VNQPHLAEARLVGRLHVLVDDRRDVARRERVQVERVLDGNGDRIGIGLGFFAHAQSTELIPHSALRIPTFVPHSAFRVPHCRRHPAWGFSYRAVTTS
jgi:hypothetical protein